MSPGRPNLVRTALLKPRQLHELEHLRDAGTRGGPVRRLRGEREYRTASEAASVSPGCAILPAWPGLFAWIPSIEPLCVGRPRDRRPPV